MLAQNLARRSEDLSTAFLGAGSTSVTHTTVGGVGTDKLIETVGGSVFHYASPSVSHVSYGGVTTGSGSASIWLFSHCLVKAAERQYFAIIDTSLVGASVTFDLTAGSISSNVAAGTFGMYADPGGGGWYWCWAALQSFNTTGFIFPQLAIFKNPGVYSNPANSYVGDGTSGLYIQKTQIQSIPQSKVNNIANVGPWPLGTYRQTTGTAVGLGSRLPSWVSARAVIP